LLKLNVPAASPLTSWTSAQTAEVLKQGSAGSSFLMAALGTQPVGALTALIAALRLLAVRVVLASVLQVNGKAAKQSIV
jgi:hypothetical protein